MDWSSRKRKLVVCPVNKTYNLLGCVMDGGTAMGGSVDKIWDGMRADGSKLGNLRLLAGATGMGFGLLTRL